MSLFLQIDDSLNLFIYEKALCFLYKSKKAPYCSFYKDKWFLNSGTFTYFTLFESGFVNVTLDGWVKTANLKTSLFIITSSIVLIKYKIFNSEKETTKVVVSKL